MEPLAALDDAMEANTRLRSTLAKSSAKQVSSSSEKDLMKATAVSWIKTLRPVLGSATQLDDLKTLDAGYTRLLEYSARNTTRTVCRDHLKHQNSLAVKVRSQIAANPALIVNAPSASPPPDLSALISDPQMQAIMRNRWIETTRCLTAGAYLAATVMMGAMLEAMLLSRINRVANKAPIFTAHTAPKDKATGQTLPLQLWTLSSYIDVAHELQWISKPARDIGVVLRDYRNFIHPAKELSQGMSIGEPDCSMFWGIFQSLAQQVVQSVAKAP